MKLSVLVRCSDDWRVLACLDSIDVDCDVVVSLTPNAGIEDAIRKRKLPYEISPKGNPAATTLAALPLIRYQRVLLVDSDCIFVPGAIYRMSELGKCHDIVRPKIDFENRCFSTRLTALARDFQYNYCGFVYEPGLLINLSAVLPLVGGYLFSPLAPFTPDGELDYRIRRLTTGYRLRIADDDGVTLRHAALHYRQHLYSHYRYGRSEATRMLLLRQEVLLDFLRGLKYRYGSLVSGQYQALTFFAVLGSDIVYVVSIVVWHLVVTRWLKRY